MIAISLLGRVKGSRNAQSEVREHVKSALEQLGVVVPIKKQQPEKGILTDILTHPKMKRMSINKKH